MTHRSYNQYCGLAYALDIVGERWTLLIIRELIAGPRRFKDLLDGLPGISTNLLAERIRGLEQQGMIRRRTLPPPAGSAVYELTAMGHGLEQTLLELGRWGSQFVPPSAEGVHVLHMASYALTLKTFFRPELAQEIDETYELQIEDEVLQARISAGQIQVQQGQPWHADLVIRSDVQSFLGVLSGQLDADAAIASGQVSIVGDRAALNRLVQICGLPGPTDGGSGAPAQTTNPPL
jgi:DNA-binding HxlR family transcriptional regulator/putative sterol carrier protein